MLAQRLSVRRWLRRGPPSGDAEPQNFTLVSSKVLSFCTSVRNLTISARLAALSPKLGLSTLDATGNLTQTSFVYVWADISLPQNSINSANTSRFISNSFLLFSLYMLECLSVGLERLLLFSYSVCKVLLGWCTACSVGALETSAPPSPE